MSVKPFAFALGALAVSAGLGTVSAAEPTAASSAVISAIQGSALVSRQDDVVPATQGMELQPLNRVFVLEESSAIITFADGCERVLDDSAILTIPASGACEAAAQIERAGTSVAQPSTAQSSFAAAAAAPTNIAPLLFPTAGAAGFAGLTATQAALIGGAVVVGGAVVIANNDDDNNNPPPAATQPSPLPPPRPISP
jgi:hypothetical protein